MVNDRIAVQERSERLAVFRARVAVVFERLPMLCGFHVTDDLSVVEVTVHDWPGAKPPADLESVLYAALEDLVEDRAEEVAELLRGRTFERALH